MLEIRDLHVEVEGKEILKGLNLTINKGEIHSIMGPNGSGKSTLAQVLAGKESYEITKGEILFRGKDLSELKPEERACEGIFSLKMIFGTVISPNEKGSEPDHDPAVFPLAIPSIASPGSIMAVVLLTDNNVRSYADQGITVLMLLIVLVLTLLMLKLANPIHKLIGNAGSNIMIRVMGANTCRTCYSADT